VLLAQPRSLGERSRIERSIASALVQVECLRTIDRLRLSGRLTEEQTAARRGALYSSLQGIEIVEVTPPVVSRASEPFHTPLGTLDALHLATALLWRDQTALELVFATHDAALGRAARSFGFEVIGL
jgi:predicted nucleic acid-binding protein